MELFYWNGITYAVSKTNFIQIEWIAYMHINDVWKIHGPYRTMEKNTILFANFIDASYKLSVCILNRNWPVPVMWAN